MRSLSKNFGNWKYWSICSDSFMYSYFILLASFLFLIVVKIIFMPAKKCSYTYTKDEGHKYSLLMKNFYFFLSKTPLHNTKRWEAFLQPPEEIFLFFRLIEYLKTKNTHLFTGECLIKILYFVVCDTYSETLAYLLKCNCLHLYFHVGMGT